MSQLVQFKLHNHNDNIVQKACFYTFNIAKKIPKSVDARM